MAKKATKAWPAVQQFLSDKTTDNFLEILVAIKKGNLVEADRKSLGEIDPPDLILSDAQFPEFEKKFVDRLIDLRFEIDFNKLDRFSKFNRKEVEENPSEIILSDEITEALSSLLDTQDNLISSKEALVERSPLKDELKSERLLPFFTSPMAYLSGGMNEKALKLIIDESMEISDFYNDVLFSSEPPVTYKSSDARKELKWIIHIFELISLRHNEKTANTEDKVLISHMSMFTLFNLNILYVLHYPEDSEKTQCLLQEYLRKNEEYHDRNETFSSLLTVQPRDTGL